MHLPALTAILAVAARTVLADGAIKLDYIEVESVQGVTNSSGTLLTKPIVAWYSVPYAAPPTGALRFKRPAPPTKQKKKLQLKDYGPVCLQGLGTDGESEDCLTLSVFKPQGVEKKDLPVVIWVPGGAFNTGGGRGLNVPSMVGNAPDDFIGVSINYRLGAFGGIPSTIGQKEGALNLGLRDQAAAFAWVQKYIKEFGGDPKQVTLFGESAGAHSVGVHLQHQWPASQRPFKAAIMNSGGPAARAWPDWTFPLYEQQADEFFGLTGCTQDEGEERWGCLRSLDAGRIANASVTLYRKYNPAITWPFQPVVDYDYVNQAPSVSWSQGQFERVPVITGYNTDEGTGFVPRSLNTTAEYRRFFEVLFPLATSEQLNEIERLYPDPVTNSSSVYGNTPFGKQFNRLASAYADYAYISTVRQNALEIARQEETPVWKYHFNKIVSTDPETRKLGVGHASELGTLTQVVKSDTGRTMLGFYSAFIATGNPNRPNLPEWTDFKTDDQRQMLFGENEVRMEDDATRTAELDWWLSVPGIAPH